MNTNCLTIEPSLDPSLPAVVPRRHHIHTENVILVIRVDLVGVPVVVAEDVVRVADAVISLANCLLVAGENFKLRGAWMVFFFTLDYKNP